jgi:hypothetical protein
MPAYMATAILAALLPQESFRVDSSFTKNAAVTVLCYLALGLTGIWFQLGESLTMYLQWVYVPHPSVSEPELLLSIVALHKYEVPIFGELIAFFPGKSKALEIAEDVEASKEQPLDGTAVSKANPGVSSSKAAKPPTRRLVIAWRVLDTLGLIPTALLFGFQVFPSEALQLLWRFYLTTRTSNFIQRKVPSYWRRFLYAVIWAMMRSTLRAGDTSLMHRKTLTPARVDFLWTRQFYLGKVILDGRRAFSAEVDSVLLAGEEMGAQAFNGSFFRQYHHDTTVGRDVFPEPWSRLRAFLEGTGQGDSEEYAWIQDEL